MDLTRPIAHRPAAGRRAALGAWWAARSPLARHVTIILIAKALVLFVLWYAFFRAPAAPHMAMEPQKVEWRLLAPAHASEAAHAVP